MPDPFFSQNYIDDGQKGAGDTANDFLFVLSGHVHLAVIDRDLTAPPGTITEGATYIPATGATGAWTGLAGKIVMGRGGEWISYTPKEAWKAWIMDEDRLLFHSGSAWIEQVPKSVQTGVTAFATGGQASAVALTAQTCIVSTVATAGDSVKLLSAYPGLSQWVYNAGANSVDVFPFSGDDINGGATNAAVAIAAGRSRLFRCVDATHWFSMLSGT